MSLFNNHAERTDTHHRDDFEPHLLLSFARCSKMARWFTTANKSWLIVLHHARSLSRGGASTLQRGYADINVLFSGEYSS